MSCETDETSVPEVQQPVQHALYAMAQDEPAMKLAAMWIAECYANLPTQEKNIAFQHPYFDHNTGFDTHSKEYPSEISLEYATHQLQHFIAAALAPRFAFYADKQPVQLEQAIAIFAANISSPVHNLNTRNLASARCDQHNVQHA
jgi:hypothetical protein